MSAFDLSDDDESTIVDADPFPFPSRRRPGPTPNYLLRIVAARASRSTTRLVGGPLLPRLA